MNAMAAGRGWRDMAIWVMPAAVYALASDTLIGVVRAWALARMQATGQALADEEATPLAVVGAVPAVAAAPGAGTGQHADRVPPLGRRGMPRRPRPQGTRPRRPHQLAPARQRSRCRRAGRRRRADGKPRKQDLLIALASQRHDLRTVPLNQVARIAGDIGAEVDLHPGTARRVLRAHVQALQTPRPATNGTGGHAMTKIAAAASPPPG